MYRKFVNDSLRESTHKSHLFVTGTTLFVFDSLKGVSGKSDYTGSFQLEIINQDPDPDQDILYITYCIQLS